MNIDLSEHKEQIERLERVFCVTLDTFEQLDALAHALNLPTEVLLTSAEEIEMAVKYIRH